MRILRYVIPVDDQVHKFSLHDLPFKVGFTDRVDMLEFWTLERNLDLRKTDFYLTVVGTGHEFFDGSGYIATTDRDEELGLVWHLIYVTSGMYNL